MPRFSCSTRSAAWKHGVDLLGVLRVALDVLLDGRRLAAPAPVDELLGQHLDGIARVLIHPDVSGVIAAFNRLSART